MTDAKTTRELVYETNRDVKWICEKVGEERRVSTISAGAGGVVAVIVRVLGGG